MSQAELQRSVDYQHHLAGHASTTTRQIQPEVDTVVEQANLHELSVGDQIAFHGLSRNILTSFPLIAAELLCILTFHFCLRSDWTSVAALYRKWLDAVFDDCCQSIVVEYVFGLYPGLGMLPSVELRLLSYATLIVHSIQILSSCLSAPILAWVRLPLYA